MTTLTDCLLNYSRFCSCCRAYFLVGRDTILLWQASPDTYVSQAATLHCTKCYRQTSIIHILWFSSLYTPYILWTAVAQYCTVPSDRLVTHSMAWAVVLMWCRPHSHLYALIGSFWIPAGGSCAWGTMGSADHVLTAGAVLVGHSEQRKWVYTVPCYGPTTDSSNLLVYWPFPHCWSHLSITSPYSNIYTAPYIVC